MTKKHCFRVKCQHRYSFLKRKCADLSDHIRFPLPAHGVPWAVQVIPDGLSWCLSLFLVCKSCKKKVNVFLVQSLLYHRCLIFAEWMIWAFEILAYSLFCPPHSGLRRDTHICSQLVRLPESHFLVDEFMPLHSFQHSLSFDVEHCSFA